VETESLCHFAFIRQSVSKGETGKAFKPLNGGVARYCRATVTAFVFAHITTDRTFALRVRIVLKSPIVLKLMSNAY
jgi:hypothetical protein